MRNQIGQRDQFLKAAKRAQEYIPYMEDIFRQEGVPIIVTRLPFVESMFNIYAVSKAGATGIWQFMPETAANYLKINHLVDERYSPFKATRAAAKFLKEMNAELQSWPLTLTAYNQGKNSLLNAIKQLGTRNIDTIVSHYKSPSFQFAGKNFYAELLAAHSVYERFIKEGTIKQRTKVHAVRPVMIGRASVSEFLKFFPIERGILEKFNPCIKRSTLNHYFHSKLPPAYEIYLPNTLALQLEKKLTRTP